MRFHCVNDGVPTETTQSLYTACAARDIEYVEIDATLFDFRPERQLRPGDLLYRPAVSSAAIRVEQFLWDEGVVTFHTEPEHVLWTPMNSSLLFERAGLPIARTFPCATTHRTLLDDWVEQLGGYPVVVKLPGSSGGFGIIRVDSPPTLYSVIDYLVGSGNEPELCTYVDDAVHWRVVVVGDRAVAAYENPLDEKDFRTYGTTDPAQVTDEVDADLAEVSIAATHLLGTELGGVDVMRHVTGRLYLLEVNFPCYHPHAQEVAGIDVAGAMVDHLVAKARRATD